MPDAMTALANLTLSSDQQYVTFSSIPTGTYRDLYIVINSYIANATNTRMRFNSDSGTNYFYVQANGNGSSAASSQQNTSAIFLNIGQYTWSNPSTFTINLMDAFATDKHKSSLVRWSSADGHVEMLAGRWANTSAITSIQLDSGSGNSGYMWTAGSTFALYGIKA
jgi:alpha-galactosidase